MARFEVTLPIVAVAYMTVEANSAEEAWETACDLVDVDDFSEWYPVKQVTRGNVCSHPQNEREINELF